MSADGRFSGIGFEDFKRLAGESNLSKYERIGFPDSYREGYEEEIFADICAKLPALSGTGKRVLDIGPGCSDLPKMLISLCEKQGHDLTLIDSQEMLNLLPDSKGTKKLAALYPVCPEYIAENQGALDAIICYSVLHYVFIDTALFRFLDLLLSLLAPGGRFLIGDIPNTSKRKRFFSSDTGKRFHREFMRTSEDPAVQFNAIEHDSIDDAVVMCILERARAQGFDSYVLPQAPGLPMENRREDILIVRP